MEDTATRPQPNIIVDEILEDLHADPEQVEEIAEDLAQKPA